MAGIGFRLNKYFKDQNLAGNLKGTLYSIIISSGPWLITIISIAFVSTSAQKILSGHHLFVLKSIINYSYAGSLLFFGAIEMPVTRYLADKLYISDFTTFKNVFLCICCFFVSIGTIFAALFYSYFDYPLMVKLAGILFFNSVLVVWTSMVFLSSAKNYHQIVISFVIGAAFSSMLAIIFGRLFALYGYLIGFSIGQSMIAIFLTINLFHEYKGAQYFSFEFLSYFKKYRRLVFVGLFYYLGIWIDKILFWFAETGQRVEGPLFTNRYYDTAMFLSYLTIVPSLALFLVQVETSFFVKYTYYFRSIDHKNNIYFLNECIRDIILVLRKTSVNLLKVQSLITVLAWYFSKDIMSFMNLPSLMEPIFRYGCLGAYLQVLFLILNIILLYFLDEKSVLKHYFVFFVTNTVLSYITIKLDFRYHGLGYALSCFITLSFSFTAINKRLRDLNYFTFMAQPLSTKNFTEAL
jgi:polysaccharide biosynthesis protein PelG